MEETANFLAQWACREAPVDLCPVITARLHLTVA
ncbi:hypothetical protein T01_5537 [Trichinella spiralis]|uniref:Uncharacterized protein n=1 Tax=Trichinella spiralis TaxID=6334 RepID=A0A0V0YRU3_TRISP|nr:hypothetical protein T01_5537 [Trichinella spiralis]